LRLQMSSYFGFFAVWKTCGTSPIKKSTITGCKDGLPALFPRDRRFIEPHPVSTHKIVFYVDIRMSGPIPYQV
jgi:hypothetical protein